VQDEYGSHGGSGSAIIWGVIQSVEHKSGAVHVIWKLAEFYRHLAPLLPEIAGFAGAEFRPGGVGTSHCAKS
jgi:hypothetical protein